jgi:hypothetical protein
MSKNEDPSHVYLHFFLRGKDIDPDEVTQLLGMEPIMKYKLGDRHGKNKEMVWKTGLWLFDSKQQSESVDINQQVILLLDQLESVNKQLASILAKGNVYAEIKIIFSLFRRNWDAILSANTITRLAGLNIPLSISIAYLSYSYEEDEMEE